MGKRKDLSAFEQGMEEGVRCTDRFECVKNSNAVGFFTLNSFPCVSRMVHRRPKDIKPMAGQKSKMAY